MLSLSGRFCGTVQRDGKVIGHFSCVDNGGVFRARSQHGEDWFEAEAPTLLQLKERIAAQLTKDEWGRPCGTYF